MYMNRTYFFSIPSKYQYSIISGNLQRLQYFDIRVGNNPSDFSKNQLCASSSTKVAHTTGTLFWCPAPIRGRYVSVQQLSSETLTICECMVWGKSESKISYFHRIAQYKIVKTNHQNFSSETSRK